MCFLLVRRGELLPAWRVGGFYEKSFVKKVIFIGRNHFWNNFSSGDCGVRFSSYSPIQKLLPLPNTFNRVNGTKNPQRLGGD